MTTEENIADKAILTVSELNKAVKLLLETHFKTVWIEGEISNLARPQSGHLYFTLKDANAQIRCAMFRMRHIVTPFEIENGMHILAYAKISLYEGRGDYQLIIEHIEEKGEGLLRRRFEILKSKLAAEGLFDTTKKQPIPVFPKRIGVITSPTGAAIKDVLSILKRRFSSIPIIIYPTAVQGAPAAIQIADAIKLANHRNECDVLIICRGGGSLEDLWAFNEEVVARAIFHSKIPIVSGIGHEIDFTISDYVVDYRAPTPSAAAELVSPNKLEYCQRINELSQRLRSYLSNELKYIRLTLSGHYRHLSNSRKLLQYHFQTIDIISQTLTNIFISKLKTEKNKLQLITIKLHHLNPHQYLNDCKNQFILNKKMLYQFIKRKLQASGQELGAIARTLNSVSPLQTLDRGYSLATKEGCIIDDIATVAAGDSIKIQVKTGYLFCSIEKTEYHSWLNNVVLGPVVD